MTLKRWPDSRQLHLAKRPRRRILNERSSMYDEFFICWVDIDRLAFQRLTQWFINKAAAANSESRHDTLAWLPLLRRLHQIRNPQPRRRTTLQQFMLDYAREVNTAFVSWHGDGKNFSNAQRLNLRYDVAKALLNGQYSHLINELDNKAKAQHDAEMDEWNLILDDISLAEDVPQYVFFLFLDFVN